MGTPVLIIGRSGTGKSASLRNFKEGEVGIINVLNKPLPFRGNHQSFNSTDYTAIKNVLLKSKVNTMVIDDAGYLITSEFMRRSREKGYDKFTELAQNFYELIEFIQHQLPAEKVVYITMHESENESGMVGPKTIGRMLDEKVCVEGMFTIVLRSVVTEGRYLFKTQSDGYDVAKSPIGMFSDKEVDNDLKSVDEVVRNYYKGE